MKGPRSRHRFHIVRTWQCPACGKKALAPVQIVNRACLCKGPEQPTWMSLVHDPNTRAPKVSV